MSIGWNKNILLSLSPEFSFISWEENLHFNIFSVSFTRFTHLRITLSHYSWYGEDLTLFSAFNSNLVMYVAVHVFTTTPQALTNFVYLVNFQPGRPAYPVSKGELDSCSCWRPNPREGYSPVFRLLFFDFL